MCGGGGRGEEVRGGKEAKVFSLDRMLNKLVVLFDGTVNSFMPSNCIL